MRIVNSIKRSLKIDKSKNNIARKKSQIVVFLIKQRQKLRKSIAESFSTCFPLAGDKSNETYMFFKQEISPVDTPKQECYVSISPISDDYERSFLPPIDVGSNFYDAFREYEGDTFVHRLSLEEHYYPKGFLASQPQVDYINFYAKFSDGFFIYA
jgi:hypothetical protein